MEAFPSDERANDLKDLDFSKDSVPLQRSLGIRWDLRTVSTLCIWTVNAPHSYHMGGVWERMIWIVKRILEALLMKTPTRLQHEVLTTLMAIMNSNLDRCKYAKSALTSDAINSECDLHKSQCRHVQNLFILEKMEAGVFVHLAIQKEMDRG